MGVWMGNVAGENQRRMCSTAQIGAGRVPQACQVNGQSPEAASVVAVDQMTDRLGGFMRRCPEITQADRRRAAVPRPHRGHAQRPCAARRRGLLVSGQRLTE